MTRRTLMLFAVLSLPVLSAQAGHSLDRQLATDIPRIFERTAAKWRLDGATGSRGRAWALYCAAAKCRETGGGAQLETARRLADELVDHPNMPFDGVPYLAFEAPGVGRDPSAAAIMACALVDLGECLKDDAASNNGLRYRDFAVRQLLALSSTAAYADRDEVGEHFFLEALHRFRRVWSEAKAKGPTLEQSIRDLRPDPPTVPKAFVRADPKRIAEIAATLGETASYPGAPASDRAAWGGIAALPAAKAFVTNAWEDTKKPIPELTDDLWLDYRRRGNRESYQRPWYERHGRFANFVLAECLEGKGRFLPHVERYLRAIDDERTWIWPAHDMRCCEWNGTARIVDLLSAETAWNLAWMLRALDGRLDAGLAARTRELIRTRVTGPYLEYSENPLSTNVYAMGWTFMNHNWNRVCHAGCCAAVLALEDDRLTRAKAIEFAERATSVYLSGFGTDGYCGEGMGYWNYGFGHHLTLGLVVRAATGGKVDLFADLRNLPTARYSVDYRLDGSGLSPTFADGNGSPSRDNLALCARIWPGKFPADLVTPEPFVPDFKLLSVRQALGDAPPAGGPTELAPRTCFDDAGVYIFRRPGDSFAAAFKPKNRRDNHLHCDSGSYVVAWDGKIVAGDPGLETYTGRTFSSDRFVSKVLGSYGHPVPLPADRLQLSPYGEARAEVLSKRFADGADAVSVELKGIYPEACALKSLVRTFTFDRVRRQVTIEDRVAFSEPRAFESPLVTCSPEDLKGHWSVEATGGEWTMLEEDIDNPGRPTPHRIAVRFTGPVAAATVRWTIRP